jgi:hypothetical protein
VNALLERLAAALLTAAAHLLPNEAATWAAAMRRELAEAPNSRAAVLFAAGCLRAALVVAASARLVAARDLLQPANLLQRPRLLGLACGAFAVGMGLIYLHLAGAPLRHLLVNLLALALGAALWVALRPTTRSRLSGAGAAVLLLAALLLGTALFGVAADGAARWVQLGPISLQTSLAFLPPMLVLYARRPDALGTVGVVLAAFALALQPDRAMAGVLAAGLLAVAVSARGRLPALAAASAILAFAWTLSAPDTLPAAPYVDRVFFSAFDVHPLAGVAVVAGAAVSLLPGAVCIFGRATERSALLAFGGCWLSVIAAAALGNYPTPLVGYGGAAVLGYLLSVALLPSAAREMGRRQAPEKDPPLGRRSHRAIPRLGLRWPAPY